MFFSLQGKEACRPSIAGLHAIHFPDADIHLLPPSSQRREGAKKRERQKVKIHLMCAWTNLDLAVVLDGDSFRISFVFVPA